jgi:hypothetical protein
VERDDICFSVNELMNFVTVYILDGELLVSAG